LCRLLGGLGKPRHISNFVRIAKKDSKGLSHPDGWGYAVHTDSELVVRKFIEPIWERFEVPPPGRAFIIHARRAERLPRSLDYVHPHVCNGVVLAHNGNAKVPPVKGLVLSRRSSSEKLACLIGSLIKVTGVKEALNKIVDVIEPKPSANFLALVPWQRTFIAFNYHNGDKYYTLWIKGNIVASEPLGKDWEPLSEDGKAKWIAMKY